MGKMRLLKEHEMFVLIKHWKINELNFDDNDINGKIKGFLKLFFVFSIAISFLAQFHLLQAFWGRKAENWFRKNSEQI